MFSYSPYCLSPAVITQSEREELDINSLLIQSYLDSAATSTYCLSPDISTHRHRVELERAATSPYCLSPEVGTHRQIV